MKKRKLFIIIAIIVICTAILVGIIFNRQPNVNIISNGDVSYYMIHDGYDEIDSKIISSYEEYKEFEKYMDEENKKYSGNYNAKKYNRKYFDTKSLAVINIVTGTGMNRYNGVEFYTEANKLICNADIKYTKSSIVTADINGKVFLVEIDKNITDFIINK